MAVAGAGVRRRLQPRAVAARGLGRGRRADAARPASRSSRVGIFSWALLEPREGEFEFGWLDDVLDRLHAAGIAVDLATATASPPPWLTRAHPRDPAGRRRRHGAAPGRPAGVWCPSSPVFREHALRLVRAMAERYGDAPGAGAVARRQRARLPQRALLLRRRRGRVPRAGCATATATVDALNDAWGTAFWSQRYADFDEILPPAPRHRRSPTRRSSWTSPGSPPTSCWSTTARERDVLRELTPGRPGHDELHGAARAPSAMDYCALGRRARRHRQRPLPCAARPATRTASCAFSADLTARPAPAASRGC